MTDDTKQPEEEVKQPAPETASMADDAKAGAKDEKSEAKPDAKATKTPKGKKAKKKKFVQNGQAYIQATYNNTIVTITDQQGNVLAWSSAGKVGFRGPKKSTPFAASIIVKDLVERVKPIGLKQVDVFIKGVGLGRESAVRALVAQGLIVNAIKDQTPTPHNGPRARKVRRV